jgi:hypothetical protein
MTGGQAGSPAIGRTNRVIFQQYPAAIRQPYAAAVVERSPAARHAKLCKLGEAALGYMASMALSDYRNRRHADPDPKAESLLAGMKRISMGQYLQIFRTCTDAIQPALFDYKLSTPDTCAAISRFSAAYAGIQDAIDLEAQNLREIVSQRLEAPARCSWLAFWDKLVEYRNRAEAHPATYSWPVAHPDYYAIMSPLLEDAVVEALTAAHVERVFADHPTATLAHISRGADRYLHDVAGEDLGLPFQAVISLDRSITDIWSQETWQARPGCHLMLARLPSGAYEISGLLHDLVTEGPPAPLAAPGRPARGAPRLPQRAPTAVAGRAASSASAALRTCDMSIPGAAKDNLVTQSGRDPGRGQHIGRIAGRPSAARPGAHPGTCLVCDDHTGITYSSRYADLVTEGLRTILTGERVRFLADHARPRRATYVIRLDLPDIKELYA